MFLFIMLILLLILITLLGISCYLCHRVILPACCSVEEGLRLELDSHALEAAFYKGLQKKDFSMVNEKGEKLCGEWLLCGKETDRILILCHGFGWNRSSSYKYAQIFLEKGYDVLVYDHIHSGCSEGKYTTMGWQESRDLKGIVSKVKENYGPACRIGTMGESMGAVTVLLHMAEDEGITFVIADCPFASLTQQLAYLLRTEYHLPRFPLVSLAGFMCRLQAGFSFSEVSPIDALLNSPKAAATPLLLIHGLADTYIPCEASRQLAEAKKGMVKLYLCPEAEHAKSYVTNPGSYREVIENFIKEK